jgi:hypothetical protein
MVKKEKFNYFKAYEKLSKLAVSESSLLIESMQAFTTASEFSEPMNRMHEFENQGDNVNHDIFHSAAIDFMPPFDREDVVQLAQALDNVLDCIDDVLGHMYMYDIHMMPDDAVKFAELILESTKALNKLMEEFHTFKKNKKVIQLVVDINSCEERADQLYQQTIRRLHTKNNSEFMHVLVWSRIYERMEKCCDATEHAADIVSTIMLKNA